MKKLITAIAAAMLLPSFGAIASGIPVFDGAAETTRQTFHQADMVFKKTVELAQSAQQSVNEINNTINQTSRMIDNAEQQFKTTIENTTGMFSDVFDDIIKKNTEKMKKSIESNSKELADAFNYGAKSVVKSVNKDKIMAWWKASASDEVCGGDGTEAKATKYEKFCAAITMADATYAVQMDEYQDQIKQDMETLDTIRQQVAKGGMTQKQMQDAQATITAISAQIELRKQAAEALKEKHERYNEMANKKARLLLQKEDSPAELQARFQKALTFDE
jgi:F0F1-type ATP synthase membrane subunit b/b'